METNLALGIAIVGVIALLAYTATRQPQLYAWMSLEPGGGRPIAQLVLSGIVLIAALYVIAVKTDSDAAQKNWASGAIGTILGFWLKPTATKS